MKNIKLPSFLFSACNTFPVRSKLNIKSENLLTKELFFKKNIFAALKKFNKIYSSDEDMIMICVHQKIFDENSKEDYKMSVACIPLKNFPNTFSISTNYDKIKNIVFNVKEKIIEALDRNISFI